MIGDGVVINKGASASIFAYGIPQSGNSAYATKGSKTVQGRWYAKHNPLSHDLPSGYTELETISGSGTQYIDTLVSQSTHDTFICYVSGTPDYDIFGNASSNYAYSRMAGVNTTILFGFLKTSENVTRVLPTISGNPSIEDEIKVDFNGSVVTIEYNDQTSTATAEGTFYPSSNTISYKLFSRGAQGVSPTSTTIKDLKILQNNTLVRHFIPCKNSSNEVGMYDLVSQTFFGNSGTGSFTAGDVVPQYFTGFFISPINEFGTWTVHAIESGSEKTQNVLIDAAEMFGVDMSEVSA